MTNTVFFVLVGKKTKCNSHRPETDLSKNVISIFFANLDSDGLLEQFYPFIHKLSIPVSNKTMKQKRRLQAGLD